jgi:hypothetical protein
MAWKPKDNEAIGSSEQIGRRLFDEPKLSGAPDQKPSGLLEMRNFLEKRSREFSVDRLGKGSVDKSVVGYLKSRCLLAENSFTKPRRFDGWAYIGWKKLIRDTPWTIHPSPKRADNDTAADVVWSDDNCEQNRYHAHVLAPENVEPKLFAYDLRERFIKEGDVYRAPWLPQPPELQDEVSLRQSWNAFWAALKKKLRR